MNGKASPEELGRALQRWTEAGVITSAQAAAILELERGEAVQSRRISLVTEVIAYLGAALALVAAIQLGSQVWPDLSTAVKAALLVCVTGLLWLGGWWIRTAQEPALRRLAGCLWAASTGGVGFLADTVTRQGIDLDAGATLTVGAVTTAYAGLLFWLRRAALQQIALFGGVLWLCGGVSDVAGGSDWFGILVWTAGAAWLALAVTRSLAPRTAGLALGSSGMLGGALALVLEGAFGGGTGVGIALGLVTAGTLLALSVALRATVLLGVGVGGLFVFLPLAVDEYLGDSLGGPVALLVTGVAVLGAALGTLKLKGRTSSEPLL